LRAVKALSRREDRCCSVEHATLVGWYHILDVNEGIISTVRFKHLKGVDDKIAQVLALALTVINFISLVQVASLEEVHDGEDLAVVWH
jgi:hypothetical protein